MVILIPYMGDLKRERLTTPEQEEILPADGLWAPMATLQVSRMWTDTFRFGLTSTPIHPFSLTGLTFSGKP